MGLTRAYEAEDDYVPPRTAFSPHTEAYRPPSPDADADANADADAFSLIRHLLCQSDLIAYVLSIVSCYCLSAHLSSLFQLLSYVL